MKRRRTARQARENRPGVDARRRTEANAKASAREAKERKSQMDGCPGLVAAHSTELVAAGTMALRRVIVEEAGQTIYIMAVEVERKGAEAIIATTFVCCPVSPPASSCTNARGWRRRGWHTWVAPRRATRLCTGKRSCCVPANPCLCATTVKWARRGGVAIEASCISKSKRALHRNHQG